MQERCRQLWSSTEVVALWERAAGAHPLVRALHMIAACQRGGCDPGTGSEPLERLASGVASSSDWVPAPEASERAAGDGGALTERRMDVLLELDLGERNRRLMALFSEQFGPVLECDSSCPECAEQVEVTMDLRRVLLERAPGRLRFEATVAGVTVAFRLPNTRDLLDLTALQRTGSALGARDHLLRRCILDSQRDGEALSFSELSSEVLEQVADEIGRCDPHAEILARLSCPECGAGFRVLIDVAEVLWAGMAARAREALRAVHVLARAYAWSEADILAMSERRRSLYLSMVGA